jgi:hypothetical protein
MGWKLFPMTLEEPLTQDATNHLQHITEMKRESLHIEYCLGFGLRAIPTPSNHLANYKVYAGLRLASCVESKGPPKQRLAQ